jgi:hypothetical protein
MSKLFVYLEKLDILAELLISSDDPYRDSQNLTNGHCFGLSASSGLALPCNVKSAHVSACIAIIAEEPVAEDPFPVVAKALSLSGADTMAWRFGGGAKRVRDSVAISVT